jgi:hypothetical protein
MKNKTAPIILWFAMTLCGFHAACVADETPIIPTAMSQMIQQALQVRKDALKYEEMRHDEKDNHGAYIFGYAGKKFRAIMDRIAESPMDETLIAKVKDLQDSDIRYKIIVWALDRKQRLGEYERFSKWYLNLPIGFDDCKAHFIRGNPDYKGERPIEEIAGDIRMIDANPVATQDAIEENRPILEFLSYAPPDGLKFKSIPSRHYIQHALMSLGRHEKSIVVWKSALDMAFDTPLGEGDAAKFVIDNTKDAVSPFMKIANKEAFSVLGAKWQQDRARDTIDLLFRDWLTGPDIEFNEAAYAGRKKHYDTWMELAKAEWETPGEKAFSEWLKQQAPPKPPPPPQYATDPNDPFLPQPPSGKSD